jgi:homoserine O-acetyltransferase
MIHPSVPPLPRKNAKDGAIAYGADALTRVWDAGPFTLECGVELAVQVAYRTWGSLNAAADNAVIVCHALTGDANVDRWWASAVGPGRGIDTDRWFVVASNVIGGCYGTTGPTSLNPATGRCWGPDFPPVTIRDMVRLQRGLLDELGVRRVATVTGGSMGGMQVLEWAAMYPELVSSIVPIAVGADHSPWCIGLSEAQRNAIFADPDWADGHYAEHSQPRRGLAVARQIGMISYRSPQSFGGRFGRASEGEVYSVESWLRYHGEELVQRFDANTYVLLTRAMDSHDVARDRGSKAEVLAGITCPALVVGITSDVLYPLAEQHELVRLLPNAELSVLDVPHGHDGFLIEAGTVAGRIGAFLARRAGVKVA